MLLTREKFRESVFQRDNYRCVFCNSPATDAHHILDRKLFIDGGYYLNNGASVCENCHMKCETTEISTKEVYKACGITNMILPDNEHFVSGKEYDKWGNEILEDGSRLMGPMFTDKVKSLLRKSNKLRLFTVNYVDNGDDGR